MRYHRVLLGKEWLVKKSGSLLFFPYHFGMFTFMTIVFLSLGAINLYFNWNKDVLAVIIFILTICLLGAVGVQIWFICSLASYKLVIYNDHVEIFHLFKFVQSIAIEDIENITIDLNDGLIYFNIDKQLNLALPWKFLKNQNIITIDYSKRRARLICQQLGTDKIIICDTPSDQM